MPTDCIAALLILNTMRPITSACLQSYVVVARLIGVKETVAKLIRTYKSERSGDVRRHIYSHHGNCPPLAIIFEIEIQRRNHYLLCLNILGSSLFKLLG